MKWTSQIGWKSKKHSESQCESKQIQFKPLFGFSNEGFSMNRIWLQTHIDWKIASRFTPNVCVSVSICETYISMCDCVVVNVSRCKIVKCRKKRIKLQWNSIWRSTRMARTRQLENVERWTNSIRAVIYVDLIKFVLQS